jgi:hypothetical protein
VQLLDTLRVLAAGRLDSMRRVDSLRYVADGRLDSVTLVRTLDSLRKVQQVISVDSIRLVHRSRDSLISWLGSSAPTVGQKTMAASLPVVISSDQTTLNVAAAAPAGNLYLLQAGAQAKLANKVYASLLNADATLKVDLVRARVCQEVTAAVTGLIRGYRLRRITAHSVGTVASAKLLDTGSPALDADITLRVNNPTTTATDTLGYASLGEEETGSGSECNDLFLESEVGKMVANQNQGFSIHQDGTAGTGVLSVMLYFRVR